jgi:ATP-dependent exoDNAse (exonuclease V) beta subunit
MADAALRLAGHASITTLANSYRTAQVVLDFVNAAFVGSLPDFPLHATAESAPGTPVVPDVGQVIVAPLLEDDRQGATKNDRTAVPDGEKARTGPEKEADLVAAALAAALGLGDSEDALPCPVFDKDLKIFRPLAAGDCAVLYRSGTNAELFEEALRARGIPCHKEEQHGFFLRPEVRDAVSLARFLCVPADLPALLAVLRSPLGRLSDKAMLGLLQASGHQAPGARAEAALTALDAGAPTLAQILRSAQGRVGREPLNAILDSALSSLGAEAAYGHALVNDPAEGRLARQNLRRFLEICLALETGSGLSPTALLAELERLAARNETGNAPGQRGSVTLMTIHKSKGLEFPLVALVDTARPWAQRDPYWVTAPAEDGDGRTFHYVGTLDEAPVGDLGFDRLAAAHAEATREECLRLLYVAMTRARQYLLVTGHRPGRLKGVEGTVFYVHLRAATAAAEGRSAQLLPAFGVELAVLASSPHPGELAFAPAPPERNEPTHLFENFRGAADRRLPAELEIVTPSQGHGAELATAEDRAPGTLPLEASVPASDAALFGSLVHAGLQAWLEERPFDLSAAFREMAPGRERPEWLSRAARQLLAFQNDPVWRSWQEAGVEIACELPLVHLAGDELVQGAADAVVTVASGRLKVIDFKTTLFESGSRPTAEALHSFSRRRGFETQVGAYARALRAIYPEALVEAEIYFVDLQRFLRLEV